MPSGRTGFHPRLSPRRFKIGCPIIRGLYTSFPPEPPMLGAEYARYVADFARLWTSVAQEANINAS
jgi:hypothetical protein